MQIADDSLKFAEFHITPNKTYATHANAVKAVGNKLHPERLKGQRFFVMRTDECRYFPVFVGQQALQGGIHFLFNVIA